MTASGKTSGFARPLSRFLLAALLLAAGGARAEKTLAELVARELRLMERISQFDFIGAELDGSTVTLVGYTVSRLNSEEAEAAVRRVKGVGEIVNKVELLPSSPADRRIRTAVYNKLQRVLPRCFRVSGPDLRIIVKNGRVILKGKVNRPSEKDLALTLTRAMEGVWEVRDEILVVQSRK